MFKHLSLTAIAVLFAVCLANADQGPEKIKIPVDRITPADGKLMFNSYCAPCHGIDAKGNGPAAAAIKTAVPDLTMLSKSHHGKYPDAHVVSVLQFGTTVSAHGSAQMPVWGPILGKMNQTSPQERLLRISNLSRYLETLQVK